MLAAQNTKLEAQLLQAAEREMALETKLSEQAQRVLQQEELFQEQEKTQQQQNADLAKVKGLVANAAEVCDLYLLVQQLSNACSFIQQSQRNTQFETCIKGWLRFSTAGYPCSRLVGSEVKVSNAV